MLDRRSFVQLLVGGVVAAPQLPPRMLPGIRGATLRVETDNLRHLILARDPKAVHIPSVAPPFRRWHLGCTRETSRMLIGQRQGGYTDSIDGRGSTRCP